MQPLAPSSITPAIWEISQREFHVFFPSTNAITSINKEQPRPNLSPGPTRAQRVLSFYAVCCCLDHIWHTEKFQSSPPKCFLNSFHIFCFGAYTKTFMSQAVKCIIYSPHHIIILSPQTSQSCQILVKPSNPQMESLRDLPWNVDLLCPPCPKENALVLQWSTDHRKDFHHLAASSHLLFHMLPPRNLKHLADKAPVSTHWAPEHQLELQRLCPPWFGRLTFPCCPLSPSVSTPCNPTFTDTTAVTRLTLVSKWPCSTRELEVMCSGILKFLIKEDTMWMMFSTEHNSRTFSSETLN